MSPLLSRHHEFKQCQPHLGCLALVVVHGDIMPREARSGAEGESMQRSASWDPRESRQIRASVAALNAAYPDTHQSAMYPALG